MIDGVGAAFGKKSCQMIALGHAISGLSGPTSGGH
jgi:hypothetical protein